MDVVRKQFLVLTGVRGLIIRIILNRIDRWNNKTRRYLLSLYQFHALVFLLLVGSNNSQMLINRP